MTSFVYLFQVADKRVLKEARGGDVWSVSGQGGSLAGDPEGASVHPVGGMFGSESMPVCTVEVFILDSTALVMSERHLGQHLRF